MAKTRETIRIKDGHRYRCLDAGCDDFERAAHNREMVARRMFTTAYQAVEEYFRHTPLHKPLPAWIPQGTLPQVGRGESRELGDSFVVDLTDPASGE